jgi:hypothetical protein
MIDPKSLDKANEEHVFIRIDGDLRKLNAYPGSVHSYVYR